MADDDVSVAGPVWTPGTRLTGFIKKKDHFTLLHIKYGSSGPYDLFNMFVPLLVYGS